MKLIGIYKITNLVNNKFYIGSSINIKKRWQEHKRDLKNSKHHSFKIQRAWDKYGSDSFLFEVLELTSEENLLIIEQSYLDNFKPYEREIGYNISHKATGGCGYGKNHPCYGKKHSEETKLNMRKNHLDFTGENNPNYGKTMPEHVKQKLIESHLGKSQSEETKQKKSIAMKGEKNHNYGKKFSQEHRQKLSEAHKGNSYNVGIKHPEERKKKISKAVVQLSKEGFFIAEFYGACEAQRQTNIQQSSITNCCNNKYGFKTAGNYKWMFSETYYKNNQA